MKTLDEIREIVDLCKFEDWLLIVKLDTNDRPYLQIECHKDYCATTGDNYSWSGRKWFLSRHMTKSEIVTTAFKAVLTANEHEVREKFTYFGYAIFGPHLDVDELVKITNKLDVR